LHRSQKFAEAHSAGSRYDTKDFRLGLSDISSGRATMSELHRITVSPDQCAGRPCIRGLRIRVKDILDLLAAGAERDEILSDYPYLEPEDIAAALEFAARQSDHPVLRSA
jgi:uncharacterized protein (DUF433 family)